MELRLLQQEARLLCLNPIHSAQYHFHWPYCSRLNSLGLTPRLAALDLADIERLLSRVTGIQQALRLNSDHATSMGVVPLDDRAMLELKLTVFRMHLDNIIVGKGRHLLRVDRRVEC